jgi:hypothetical protein
MNNKITKPVSKFEELALYSFTLTIRDRTHFYKITEWMNSNIGISEKNWAMAGRPLKQIKKGLSPTIRVYIMNNKADENDLSYLKLL